MLDNVHPASVSSDAPTLEVGPLVRLHVGMARMPWRIGPAWSVLAGALATGAPLATADALLRLAAAVVLADLAWGVLHRFIPAQAGTVIGQAASPSVPYGQPAAPLTRFLLALAAGQKGALDEMRVAWQGLFAGLVFTAVLSMLLGIPAIVLSLLAVGILWLARALVYRGNRPALCLALLDVGLPWLVGMSLTWRSLDAVLPVGMEWPAVVLAMAFTMLQWGLHRARLAEDVRTGGMWLGQAFVLIALIGLQQAWALGVTAVLFVPPSWRLAKRTETGKTLIFSLLWWWAAMLLAAAAVR